jgi:hypothetical protein
VALADPTADFDWTPQTVVAGTPVTLTSTSMPADVNTPITKIDWDLDGDRKFETSTPAGANAVTVPAPAPRHLDRDRARGRHRPRGRPGDQGNLRRGPATSASTGAASALPGTRMPGPARRDLVRQEPVWFPALKRLIPPAWSSKCSSNAATASGSPPASSSGRTAARNERTAAFGGALAGWRPAQRPNGG